MTDHRAFYIEVGLRIRREREKCALTQEALASLTPLSRTSITNIEKGRQKLMLHTLVDIAAALKVPPVVLIPEVEITLDKNLNELLKGRPRKAQEWIKSTVKSIRKEK